VNEPFQIDADHPIPIRGRDGFDCPGAGDAGVVAEDVNLAEFAQGFRRGRGEGFAVRHVAGRPDGANAFAAKDVDGFHPVNVGFLSTQRPGLVPCTPGGVMEILKRSGIAVAGREAVVVGRSDIVGKPAAMLLLNANATVTVCHSKTHDLPGVCRRADILVAAIGRAGMITRDFVRPGATVIDVGMNTVTDAEEFRRFFGGNVKREEGFRKKGSTLMGDVHPEVAEVAGAITPVPGGVGPLTIAMLMFNAVKAARMRRGNRLSELSRA